MSHPTQGRRAPRSLVRQLADLAHRTGLFESGDRLLIAVSGGPDSVALLSLLSELAPSWRLELSVVHINHGLRGRESDEDARFVVDLCQQLGVPVKVEPVPLTTTVRLREGRSLQEVAREARYAAMRRLAQALGVGRVALGHQADDQAETVLMWMLRGAGAKGLGGIPPVREEVFIRPLLDIRRSAILSYLEGKGLAFREDSSNTNPAYLRNRIRHELLPTLLRWNPAIVELLGRQADILREEDRWLDEVTTDQIARLSRAGGRDAVVLDREGFLALPVALQRRVVRRLIGRVSGTVKGPSFGAVSAVLENIVMGSSGSEMSVQGVRVARDYDHISFGPVGGDAGVEGLPGTTGVRLLTHGIPVTAPSVLPWPPTGQLIRISLRPPLDAGRPVNQTASRTMALLDANRFTVDLRVRTWQPGDVFQPLGMGGRRKKLQDFFSDMKVPRKERHRVPLLTAPEGILWVGGYRADHRFRITRSTSRILVAELVDRTS